MVVRTNDRAAVVAFAVLGSGGWGRAMCKQHQSPPGREGGREAASYRGLRPRRGLPPRDQVSHAIVSMELNRSRLVTWAPTGS